jgi:hypothetical protein
VPCPNLHSGCALALPKFDGGFYQRTRGTRGNKDELKLSSSLFFIANMPIADFNLWHYEYLLIKSSVYEGDFIFVVLHQAAVKCPARY